MSLIYDVTIETERQWFVCSEAFVRENCVFYVKPRKMNWFADDEW